MRTPLAWKNMTNDKRKLVLIAGGVGFAVVLMFMQIGFYNALFDSTVQLIELLDADIIVVSKGRYNLPSEQRFDRSILDRARSDSNVERVIPFYIERSQAEIHVVGEPTRAIRVLGVPLQETPFISPEINEKIKELDREGVALLDEKSKKAYRFQNSDPNGLKNQEIELNGRKISLIGLIRIGTDFVHDGTILVSMESMSKYFPYRNRNESPLKAIDLGLVRLKDKSLLRETIEGLRELEPDEINVYSKEDLIALEKSFWAKSTPIGVIFFVGTIMGLVVGTIICYQILFTDISDHISEFATLKAMGYGSFYFLKLVLEQSLYLTLLGFLPGLALTSLMFTFLSRMTGLVMMLNVDRIALVFGLTLAMCMTSGFLAVRKLWSADPASLFK